MRKILVDCLSSKYRTAVMENGELVEFIIDDKQSDITVGSIYVGKVEKILPARFAFVNIGDEKNAFLYLNDKKEEQLYTKNGIGIEKLKIKQGQDIIVQVLKEAVDEKGSMVTTELSFTGKYVVLICSETGVNVSKKITDEEIKKRLIKNVKEALPEGYGVILRTNCIEASYDDIKNEIITLLEKHKEIISKGCYTKAPSKLYGSKNETEKAISDLIINDEDEIIVNGKEEYIGIKKAFGKAVFYDENIPMFENYFVEGQLEKALNKRVWLKCGGWIEIEHTEACTVIDVNTGKYSAKGHRETVLKVNLQAAEEVAKQLRLRNISGMIIIDFIDMQYEADREQVEKHLEACTKNDRVRVSIVGMTKLGIMQLTRKKTRQPLYKALMCKCPQCGGTGLVLSEFYIAEKIRNKILALFSQTVYKKVVLSSNIRVINAFKGVEDDYKKIEDKFGTEIEFKIIQTQRLDYFEIEKA